MNDNGEAVWLLQPIVIDDSNHQKERKKKKKKKPPISDPTCCFIGGEPSYCANDDRLEKHLLHTKQRGKPDKDDEDKTNSTLEYTNPSINCGVCHGTMYLLLQMYAPLDEGDMHLDRTLYVFGCNRPSCYATLFGGGRDKDGMNSEKKDDEGGMNDSVEDGRRRFCFGGGGVVRCLRSQSESSLRGQKSLVETVLPNISSSDDTDTKSGKGRWDSTGWDNDEGGNAWGENSDDTDWAVDGYGKNYTATKENGSSLGDLEAMLAQCEMRHEERKDRNVVRARTSSGKKKNLVGDRQLMSTSSSTAEMAPMFPRYELEIFDEPAGSKGQRDLSEESDDDDGDEIGCGGNDNEVQKMLAKYLEEEKDEDILAALQGKSGGDGQAGGGAVGEEKYERLPPDERAFLAFAERLKRAPRQIARYAYGGIPLWSIPTPTPKCRSYKSKFNQESIGNRNAANNDRFAARNKPNAEVDFTAIPCCSCGSDRVFEFQVMPSILHVLNVDQCSPAPLWNESTRERTSEQKKDMELMMSREYMDGGMNWGAVAIYSCVVSCDESREEFVIVQESADAKPKKRVLDSRMVCAELDDED